MSNAKVPGCELRSTCPIAATLDVVGDRWTLLVLRDALFLGKSLFQEFLESPEGISSNTLAERLKRLEKWGILVREVYQRRPLRARYRVTPRGEDLRPLLKEALRWGARHVEGAFEPTPEQLRLFLRKRG